MYTHNLQYVYQSFESVLNVLIRPNFEISNFPKFHIFIFWKPPLFFRLIELLILV